MNQLDKVDQFLRLLMLTKPGQYWPTQGLTGSESAPMTEDRKNQLLTGLTQKYSPLTFGQILTQQFIMANITPMSLATELGIPTEVVEYLAKDNIHPATIPIMVMKRLLERLNVSLETARIALRASFEQLKTNELGRPTLGFGIAARKASDLEMPQPVAGWTDSVGSEESLNQYLDRLTQYMPS